MGLFMKKLSNKTGIHGLEHAVKSEKLFQQIFWFALFLLSIAFAIYQIITLTGTFTAEEIVTSNRFAGPVTGEKFLNLFKPIYCAQDWLNVSKIQALNANPIALIVASESLGALDFYAFRTLRSMLSSDQKMLVNGDKMGSFQDWSTYFIPTVIQLNHPKSFYQSILNLEIKKQAVDSKLDLLKKFTNRFFPNENLEAKLGGICQYVSFAIASPDQAFSITFYKTQFRLDTEHFYLSQRAPPKCQILLQPDRNETDELEHPFLDTLQYVTEINYHQSMEMESNYDVSSTEQHLVYNLAIDARYHQRIVTRSSKCLKYLYQSKEKARLTGLCNLGCETVLATNFTDVQNFKKEVLGYLTNLSSTMMAYDLSSQADTSSEEQSEDEPDETKVVECKQRCSMMLNPCQEWEIRMKNNGIVRFNDHHQLHNDYDYSDFTEESMDTQKFDDFNESVDFKEEMHELFDTSTYNNNTARFGNETMLKTPPEHADVVQPSVSTGKICGTYPNITGVNIRVMCRKRTFSINLYQYVIISEKKLMTFVDYVGSVGGSLGVFMGASIISFLQLCFNCCGICRKRDDQFVVL